MMSRTTTDVFKDFLNQAISAVLDPRLNDYPEGPELISSLNLTLGKVLSHGHQTNTLWWVNYNARDFVL